MHDRNVSKASFFYDSEHMDLYIVCQI